jgi:hypothetical protein
MKKTLGIFAALVVITLGLIAASPQGHWITIFGSDWGIVDSSDNKIADFEVVDKSFKSYGPIDSNGLIRANAGLSATGSIYIDTSGQPQQFSTYKGANSDGYNIFIGGGGNSSVGAVGETSKGSRSTSIGYRSMYSNTKGYNNTAGGYLSAYNNTTGYNNVILGYQSFYLNTSGYNSVILGLNSAYNNTTGYENTVIGYSALFSNKKGRTNAAVGNLAGAYLSGTVANTTPTYCVYLGASTRGLNANDTNSIVIGYNAQSAGSNTVVIGNDSITQTTLKGNVNTAGNIQGASITATVGMQSSYYTIVSLAALKDNVRSATDGTKITKFIRQPVPVLRIFNWNNPIPMPEIKNYKSYNITPEENPFDETRGEVKSELKPIEVTAEEQYQKALSSWQQIDRDPFYQRDRLGFIVEELPLKYLADDNKGWDISTFVVEHEGKLQQLYARVEKLEGERK